MFMRSHEVYLSFYSFQLPVQLYAFHQQPHTHYPDKWQRATPSSTVAMSNTKVYAQSETSLQIARLSRYPDKSFGKGVSIKLEVGCWA